jgi:hypothetical protein
MTKTTNGKDERMFTIELRSKADVKNVSVNGDEKVFIEGSIGSLIRARFLEGIVLEIIGSNGELRVDLTENDFQPLSKKDDGSNDDRRGRQ